MTASVSSNNGSGPRLLARAACWGVATTATFSAFPAHAQQSAAADGASQLQEVMVTAEKRSLDLQRAPAAITAVQGSALTELGAVNLPDLSNQFPSARLEPFFGWAHLFVRGIGAEQDRVTVDQLVNVFVDGVVLPREMVGTSQSDVSAIELLPGPQGTLYGASSVGGVLTVRGNRPTQDNVNDLVLEYGNFASLHFKDMQNVRVNDVLALRGSIDYVNHSAYETTDRWTANTLNAKVAALFTPSDSFSAYVWAQAYNNNSLTQEAGFTTASGQWIPKGDPWDALNDCATLACNGAGNRPLQPPQTGTSHDNIVSGQFDWHVNGLTVSDTVSLLNVDMRENVSALIFTDFLYQANHHQVTDELKIASDPGAALEWLGGLYLYQDKADSQVTFANYDVTQYKLQNVAPYGQLIYAINDKFRVTTGARYTKTYKDGTFAEPNVLPQTSANWSNVDWKVGVEYDLARSMLAYATVQTGSSPGTFDPGNVVNGRPNITKLTKLDSLTVGWKSQLFENRLQLNNEIFYYDYKDFLIQTITCSNPAGCFPLNNVYLNAPRMTSVGDQFDLRWLVTEHDALHVGYAFTQAETGNWRTDAGADLSHQTLMEAPRNTVTVGGQHSFDLYNGGKIVLRADAYLSSGYFADFQTQPGIPVHLDSVHQTAYSTTNVALTYHSPQGRWTLGLWARNLENTAQFGPAGTFIPNIGPVAALVPIVGAPRTYGAQFTLHVPTDL
jgi:iron complex outermembrane receptor protein